jgi:hypothetical protein
MINSPSPKKKRTITLETQWYDDQYDDNGVDVNAPGDDDGYVEPLEQTDDFGESAYEYTYHPQDDQEQQPEEYYYPEEMPELIRTTEESSVSQIAKIRNLPMRRLENNLVYREPWSEKKFYVCHVRIQET